MTQVFPNGSTSSNGVQSVDLQQVAALSDRITFSLLRCLQLQLQTKTVEQREHSSCGTDRTGDEPLERPNFLAGHASFLNCPLYE